MQTEPQIKSTSPGEWIVTSTDDGTVKLVSLNANGSIVQDIAIVCGDEENPETLGNAALLSISKDMLDVLIAVQMELNTSKDVIDLEAINGMISDVFAKLANEAGEEF